MKTMVHKGLNQKVVVITKDGKAEKMPLAEALIATILHGALKGDPKMVLLVLKWLSEFLPSPSQEEVWASIGKETKGPNGGLIATVELTPEDVAAVEAIRHTDPRYAGVIGPKGETM